MSHIHFAAGGNDFGGTFLWATAGTLEEPITVQANTDKLDCRRQVRGLYYNSQRGERLWPLDDLTATQLGYDDSGLVSTGGLYTSCSNSTLVSDENFITVSFDYLREALLDGENVFYVKNDESSSISFTQINILESELIVILQNNAFSESKIQEFSTKASYFLDNNTLSLIPGKESLYWDLFKSFEDYLRQGWQDIQETYGIYGYLTHTFSSKDYKLIAGVQYEEDSARNLIQYTSPLAPTFQRFNNQIPLGFVYDLNGGLGFVGCEVKAGLDLLIQTLNTSGVNYSFLLTDAGLLDWSTIPGVTLQCTNLGITLDSLLLLKIQGIIGLSSDLSSDYAALDGNESSSKTQYFSSVSVNNATLINAARRNAQELCRGGSTATVLCLKGDQTRSVSSLAGQIVIIENGNLTLNGSSTNDSQPLNIFIDKGNLILTQTSDQNVSFNAQGFPEVPATSASIASGVFLKGNFVVNGLVSVKEQGTKAPKLFIHGKFTSLNTYATPSTARQNQLNALFPTNRPTSDQIDLTKVFTWRCGYGQATDGSSCPPSEFQNAPLVIINQNYPSRLLQ
ncbi:MAG: hypothetical protein PHT72_03175 [Candidatus Absconditabacteria bacterium]|nr:hypothetical protein [Candidatus Absconditabacteria bacterium]